MTTLASPTKPTPWLDMAAIGLSGLCLMHCLGTGLLLGLITAGNLLELWHSWQVHMGLLAVATPLTLYTLVRSYRCHGGVLPLLLGICGLKLMAIALVFHAHASLEAGITLSGVVLVALAHGINMRRHAKAG
jgi:MerC mercury resistance protein